jgi:AraC-like DNA-binding protein
MAASAPDDVLLMLFDKGNWAISQFRHELSLTGRSTVLMSSSHPMTLERSSSRFTSITIPRATLAPLVSNLDAAVMSTIPRDLEAMRLLTGYLDLLVKGTPVVTAEVRRLAITHVHDLVAMAIGATRDAAEIANGRGLRAARLRAVKSDIAAHLAGHDLKIGAVAVRLGISDSYIRKLLEGEDTSFSDFVLEHRLTRAHRMLTDPRFAQRSITSIAFDAGFGDLSYFNRCFRRRFGDTPSGVRAEAARHDIEALRRPPARDS